MEARNLKVELHKYFYVVKLSENCIRYIECVGEKTYLIAKATLDWCSYCNGTGARSYYDICGYDIDKIINDDMDSREAYFSGQTDRCCDKCNGTKVLPIIDETKLNEFQKEILKHNDYLYREDDINEATRRAENQF
jgi:hypothetical protein